MNTVLLNLSCLNPVLVKAVTVNQDLVDPEFEGKVLVALVLVGLCMYC